MIKPTYNKYNYPKMNCEHCGKECEKKVGTQRFCIKCSNEYNKIRSGVARNSKNEATLGKFIKKLEEFDEKIRQNKNPQ